MATIITSNFARTLSGYEADLNYCILYQGTVSEALAAHWQASELTGAKIAIMGPESGAPVVLRFIDYPNAVKAAPRPGWFALEICIQNAAALYEELYKGVSFRPFAKPKPLPFSDALIPMQCKGSAGEIIYLNEIRSSTADIDLPLAQSEVDHLFISVLTAGDMEASHSFYANALGIQVNEHHEIPYKTLNRVFGLPLDTPHKLVTLGQPRRVTLEINQAPKAAKKAAGLSEGIWMVTFMAETFDGVISPVLTLEDTPYYGARSAIGTGPDGERFELINLG